MHAHTRSTTVLRWGLRAAGLTAAGALGFLVAIEPDDAAADGLPLPTLTIPSLPLPTVTLPTVTVPPVLPPTTTSTATTTAPAPTGPTTTAAAAAPPAPVPVPGDAPQSGSEARTAAAETTVAGAVRLPNGAISIPVTSVRAPAGLVLAVQVAPRVVGEARQAAKASVRLSDTRGYLVRGARIAIRSVPAGKVVPVTVKRTADDGRASLVVRATKSTLRTRGRLSLVVTAADPARLAVAASRAVAIQVRPRR